MRIIRPLQLTSFNQVIEHKKNCYFIPSVYLVAPMSTDKAVEADLDIKYLGSITEQIMASNPYPDMLNPKLHGEYLVSGKYYAAHSNQDSKIGKATVQLDNMTKSLSIVADGDWSQFASQPLTDVPLSYTNAFGGKDYKLNPRGIGFNEKKRHNIDIWDKTISDSSSENIEPAGFDAMLIDYEQRKKYMGTYDKKWIDNVSPAYPDDMNWKYFNIAPQDQWLKDKYFSGTEQYTLGNMHPTQAVIKGTLPPFKVRYFVKTDSSHKIKEINTNLDTVWFFPSIQKVLLLWHGWAEVSNDEATEISAAMTVYEDIDKPRSQEFYQQAFDNRINPTTKKDYAFDAWDLVAQSNTCCYTQLMKSALSSDNLSATKKMMLAKKKKLEDEAATEKEKYEQECRAKGIESNFDQIINSGDEANESAQFISQSNLPVGRKESLAGLMEWKNKVNKISSESAKKIEESLANSSDSRSIKKLTKLMDESSTQLTKQLDDEKYKKYMESVPIEPLHRYDMESINKMWDEKQEWDNHDPTTKSISDEELQIKKDDLQKRITQQQHNNAHLKDIGSSPHEKDLATLKIEVLDKYKNNQELSNQDYACIDLSNQNLSGVDFSNSLLEQVNFSGANLSGANFTNAVLARVNFTHANLDNTIFDNSNIGKASFYAANLTNVRIIKSIILGANFEKATLENAYITEISDASDVIFKQTNFNKSYINALDLINNDLSDCTFYGAEIGNLNFIETNLEKVDFSSTKINYISFIDSNVNNSKFTRAKIETFMILGEKGSSSNIDFSTASIKSFNGIKQKLTQCNFDNFNSTQYFDVSKGDISDSSFLKTNLTGAMFQRTKMHRVDFSGSNLQQAKFNKADAQDCAFIQTNAYLTDFRFIKHITDQETDKRNVIFNDANLDRARFK